MLGEGGVYFLHFDCAQRAPAEQVIIQSVSDPLLPSNIPWVLNVEVEGSLLYVKMRGGSSDVQIYPIVFEGPLWASTISV